MGELWSRQQKRPSLVKPFDHVYASPALRTKTTASIVCGHIGIEDTLIKPSELLLELTHGDWDGQPRNVHHTPEVLENMKKEGWNWKSPVGGESLGDVETRMRQFVEQEILPLENTSSEPITILAVSHSIAIRTLLKSLLACDERMIRRHGLENTAVSEFWKYPEGWSLQRWNDCSHLVDL